MHSRSVFYVWLGTITFIIYVCMYQFTRLPFSNKYFAYFRTENIHNSNSCGPNEYWNIVNVAALARLCAVCRSRYIWRWCCRTTVYGRYKRGVAGLLTARSWPVHTAPCLTPTPANVCWRPARPSARHCGGAAGMAWQQWHRGPPSVECKRCLTVLTLASLSHLQSSPYTCSLS